MDMEALRKYCVGKKGAYEDFPFDEKTLVFKVGSKMFGLTNINSEVLSINLKCEPFLAQDLRTNFDCIKPGYHMNKEHWNTVIIDGSIEDAKITWMIDHSYGLVFKGLKKAEKLQIENADSN
jgi:predicted DNA-binding protein (MmcQ/YjbR family)